MPALTPYKNEITFEVMKSENKCIWIGLGDLNCLRESSFANSYKQEGHTYWIWQAGCEDDAEYYS